MADFETKDLVDDFLEVGKPDESTPKRDEAEDEPVSSTTADEPPKDTSPLIDFGGSERMDEPVVEETTDETPREDEKPATEELQVGSPKGNVHVTSLTMLAWILIIHNAWSVHTGAGSEPKYFLS